MAHTCGQLESSTKWSRSTQCIVGFRWTTSHRFNIFISRVLTLQRLIGIEWLQQQHTIRAHGSTNWLTSYFEHVQKRIKKTRRIKGMETNQTYTSNTSNNKLRNIQATIKHLQTNTMWTRSTDDDDVWYVVSRSYRTTIRSSFTQWKWWNEQTVNLVFIIISASAIGDGEILFTKRIMMGGSLPKILRAQLIHTDTWMVSVILSHES